MTNREMFKGGVALGLSIGFALSGIIVGVFL